MHKNIREKLYHLVHRFTHYTSWRIYLEENGLTILHGKLAELGFQLRNKTHVPSDFC